MAGFRIELVEVDMKPTFVTVGMSGAARGKAAIPVTVRTMPRRAPDFTPSICS
jgi:hypothetical protein